MNKDLFPSADHIAHIFKFYVSVAAAGALVMLIVTLLAAKPWLLPVAVLGFACGRYQNEIMSALTAYWRGVCSFYP